MEKNSIEVLRGIISLIAMGSVCIFSYTFVVQTNPSLWIAAGTVMLISIITMIKFK